MSSLEPYRHPAASFDNRVAKATSQQNNSITGVFVFVLLGLFAVMSTLMVLLGAQMYRNTVDHSAAAGADRVLTSYVRTMIRGMDEQDVIAVEELQAGDEVLPVLTFREVYEGDEYVTQLYLWEGELRELFTESSYDFEPESGETIIAASRFEPTLRDGLLTVELGDADGKPSRVQVALRAQP